MFSSKKMLNEGQKENDLINKNSEQIKNNIFEEASKRNHYLELQRKYIQGAIKEEEMSSEEIDELEKIFDEQIQNTQK